MGFSGNLPKHIKWVDALEGKLRSAAKEALTGPQAVRDYHSLAVSVFNEVVYAPYTLNKFYKDGDGREGSGRPTGDLLRAIFVNGDDLVNLKVGLDSSITPAVTTPEFSYGKYFLPEYSHNSFLVKTKPGTETRPFADEWKRRLKDNILSKTKIELKEAIK